MTEPIGYINVATTATVGASILIALGPISTGQTALTATGEWVLTASLLGLAAIALLLAVTDDGGDDA